MDELDDTSTSSVQADRRDLLVGREKRLRKAYEEIAGVLYRRLSWVDEALDERRTHRLPALTLVMFDNDMAGTFIATATKAETALRAWLVVREELEKL